MGLNKQKNLNFPKYLTNIELQELWYKKYSMKLRNTCAKLNAKVMVTFFTFKTVYSLYDLCRHCKTGAKTIFRRIMLENKRTLKLAIFSKTSENFSNTAAKTQYVDILTNSSTTSVKLVHFETFYTRWMKNNNRLHLKRRL